MDGDTKVWLVIFFLSLMVGGSYYGTYKYGERRGLLKFTQIFIESTKETYGEGYSDGLKQGQLDCVVKGTKNERG